MPTANPDSTTTSVNQPVVIPVLDNDIGDGLSITGLTQPDAGSAEANPDQTITYTPPSDFVGFASFGYTITDVHGGTSSNTVSVQVAMPNTPPVADNIFVSTLKETKIAIPVLAHASDPDGDPLGVVGLGRPMFGSVALTPDKSVAYLPQTGFVGDDGFGYTVGDGRGGFASASVTIKVRRPNKPPIARDDHAATQRDTPVAIAVLENDEDPDGDPITVAALTMPPNGTVALSADGTVTYTPSAGFVGTDGFTYTIRDSAGATASATVTVKVADLNQPPVAADVEVETPQATPIAIAVLDNDHDPDGDPLSVIGLTAPRHGGLAVSPDQTVTYTPKPAFVGVDSFLYTIGDGRGGLDSATVTITVIADNDPLEAVGITVDTQAGQPVTIDVLAHLGDPEGTELSVIEVTDPAHGSAVIDAGQTVTYTPDVGFAGQDSFLYTVENGNGGSSQAQITVEVEAAFGEAWGDGTLWADGTGWVD